MASLLVFSRDPGPTNYLIALLGSLAESPTPDEENGLRSLRDELRPLLTQLHVVTRPSSHDLWREAGFSPTSWLGADDAAAEVLLSTNAAGALLTGTSDVDEPGDRALWRAASRCGVTSHVVLDHPGNMWCRFHDRDGTETYPDWLYVPDKVFAKRLTDDALKTRTRIVGDLHHARIRRLSAACSLTDIARLRSTWGASPRTDVILFASECEREMEALGRSGPYDEVAFLSQLLETLDRGERPGGGTIDPSKVLLVIRPHPRDSERKYDFAIERGGLPNVTVSRDGSAPLALMAADLIVGMQSALLYEAAAVGRPVVSLVGVDIRSGKSVLA